MLNSDIGIAPRQPDQVFRVHLGRQQCSVLGQATGLLRVHGQFASSGTNLLSRRSVEGRLNGAIRQEEACLAIFHVLLLAGL